MDVSSMNEQLKEFIQNEINVTCNNRIEEFETKQRILGNSISEMYNKNLRLSQDTLNQQLENLTISFKMSQMTNDETIERFVNNSMAQIDREFDKKLEEMKKKILAEHTAKLHNFNQLYEEKFENFTRDTSYRIEMLSKSVIQEKHTLIPKEKEFNNTETTTDSAGKEFYLIFLDNLNSRTEVRLYMVPRQTGICNIYIPYLSTNKSVDVSNTSTSSYIINRNILMKYIGIENKSVHIKCNVDISLFGMNYATRNSDGYIALPFNRLGQRHVVPTFKVQRGPANVGVVSPLDNTVITILLKTAGGSVTYGGNNYYSGQSFSVTLLQYQTFYISHNHDLSGTIISSSKPVAVVSGVQMSVMNDECCNHMTEMILPARQLGKDFIVPVLYNSQCNVRILADRSSEISIHGSKMQNKTLQAGEFLELTNYVTTTINSNHGILVQIYCDTTSQTKTYDSIMVTLPSIQHYKSEYQLVVVSDFPDDQPPDHFYITIMIRSDAIHGIRLDGKSKIQYIYTSNNISMLAQSYLVLIHEIQPGGHTIEQIDDVPFGLIVNGKTTLEGYGYPAGFRLNP
ncbi:IgGFc-binding protein-like [Mytilus trossulus]|uniref:IgGFc-binding protein-like n=1 Tax=Mytilus trossulus TaxID=6551 RepID=UPI003005A123